VPDVSRLDRRDLLATGLARLAQCLMKRVAHHDLAWFRELQET
jgi:hypothetical protein